MLDHVRLDRRRLRECTVTYVTSQFRLALERMLDEMRLELRRRVERAAADLALVHVSLVQNVRGDVQLDFIFGGKRFLTLDALVGAPMVQSVDGQEDLIVKLHTTGGALEFGWYAVLTVVARLADVVAPLRADPRDKVFFRVEGLEADAAGEQFD